MGSGKAGGVPEILWDIWETARFGLKLGLSAHAVRRQYFELLRRDAPRPAVRIGQAANVLDGAAGRQAVYITMEPAPRPNGGLWMRVDIFGREGYRQTFYPFWRDPEVFHDFLAMCAEIAEAPVRRAEPREADAAVAEHASEAADTLTVDVPFQPAADRPAKSRPGLRRLADWLVARLKGLPAAGRRQVARARRIRTGRLGATGRAPAQDAGPVLAPETPEPDSHAIQTTARRGEQIQGKCTLLGFTYLEDVLDHVLLTGHRVAVKVNCDGPDLWAVIWRRADGGLYLRWGGLEHPAGPIHRESPQSLYQKLGEYDLDLERVWSQARPPAV
ncbi:MAG: hypothetical protein FJZ01_07475 [Candidatus Sericytochromatia bacterium]|nr:hypothetical protein [Candidatus Tanganyikabacteria bacterium]